MSQGDGGRCGSVPQVFVFTALSVTATVMDVHVTYDQVHDLYVPSQVSKKSYTAIAKYKT